MRDHVGTFDRLVECTVLRDIFDGDEPKALIVFCEPFVEKCAAAHGPHNVHALDYLSKHHMSVVEPRTVVMKNCHTRMHARRYLNPL